MVQMSAARPVAAAKLPFGWVLLACALTSAMLVAEYLGPIVGIAFALASCGGALLCGVRSEVVHFPAAGYWLVGILATGAVTAVIANYSGATPQDIDVQRDIGISLSYLLFLVIGYTMAGRRDTFRLLLAALVAAGLLISVVHLVRLITVLSSGVTDLYLFRLEAGRGSVTQFVALCACLLLLCDDAVRARRRVVMGCAGLLVISMLLTLSRGLMLSLIILVLVTVGLGVNRAGRFSGDLGKLLLTIGAAATGVVVFYYLTMAFLPGVQAFLDEFFVTRVVNSVTEVSATNLQTRTQIADNYRAFESGEAIRQFSEQPLFAQMIGQGWGSAVRFGLETASTKVSFSRTEAAFLHNGYAYFLMKSGLVGALMYVAFLIQLAGRAVAPNIWPRDAFTSMQRRVLLALVLALAVGTVTTGGLGYPATYLGLAVLLGACYAWPRQDTNSGERVSATSMRGGHG
jgi:hypothetical protein